MKWAPVQASITTVADEHSAKNSMSLARVNFLRNSALPDLSLAVNVKGMLAEIDTNKRNVLHDGLLH